MHNIQAGYLVSLRACINIVVLLLILPLILKHISSVYNFSASAADLWLAKASSVFMVAGCLMIGFSASACTLITCTYPLILLSPPLLSPPSPPSPVALPTIH